MNRGILKTAVAIFLLLATTRALPAPADCEPWNSDVLTGDALIEKRGITGGASVSNGVQGGAFFLLRFFQAFISPQDGANCRHTPTCSSYAKHAVLMHGAFIGSVLAGDRLIRCNPFYPPSEDPVPEKPFAK